MKRHFLRALLVLCCAVLFAPAASAGIFAYYSFDTDYTDGSGNGRDGTLAEDGTGNVLGNSGITSTAGNFQFGGGALNLIGEAGAPRDYVSVASKTFAADDNFSFAFWARKSAGDTSGPFQWDMVVGSTANNNNFLALHDGSNSSALDPGNTVLGVLRFRSGGTGIAQQSDWLSINQDDYTWNHHAVVIDGVNNTTSYYLNGSLVSTQTGKSSSAFTYNGIGGSYGASSDFDFRGQLDEFYIFDEAISAATVTSLFQTNSIPEPSTFVLGALGLGWLGFQVSKRRRYPR